jgi:hypothetical protein
VTKYKAQSSNPRISKREKKAGNVAQYQCLASTHEALGFILNIEEKKCEKTAKRMGENIGKSCIQQELLSRKWEKL